MVVISATPAGRVGQLRAADYRVVRVEDLDPMDDPFDAEAGSVRERLAVIGGVEAWQARWSALARLRGRAVLLTDGLAPSDFRIVTGRQAVPPPVSHPAEVLLVPAEGPVARRRLLG